jgi:hypothetical protein
LKAKYLSTYIDVKFLSFNVWARIGAVCASILDTPSSLSIYIFREKEGRREYLKC